MNRLIKETLPVVLENERGRAEVLTYGARVISYKPVGGEEVLFTPRDMSRADERFVHGGIPVCWPWFGRYGGMGTALHGFIRSCEWRVEEVEQSCLVLGLISSEATRRIWPFDFRLRYVISVGECLSLRLTSENMSDRPFLLTQGFHPYFLVNDAEQVVVRGLANDLEVHAGIDGRRGCNDAHRYEIDRGEGKGKVALEACGENNIVVWNPGPSCCTCTVASNLEADDWRSFVCVEPIVGPREGALTVDPGMITTFGLNVWVDESGNDKRENAR